MDTKKLAFLTAVVGEQGAEALSKASSRSESIEGILIPRAIMAWLGVIGRFDYEGEIPGVEDSYLDFAKNEDGLYDGTIAVGEGVFPFENANSFQLAASIAVALDSAQPSEPVKDIDIARLGKSIDILAKAKMVSEIESELAKMVGGGAGAGVPGPAHAPTAQVPSIQAVAPMKQPKIGRKPPKAKRMSTKPVVPGKQQKKIALPKPPDPRTMTPGAQQNAALKRSEHSFALSEKNLISQCPECGLGLIKNEKFVGCICLRDLAKNVSLTKHDGKHYISFDNDLEPDAVSVILETLGVK